jgi:ABC-2 type transport system ATP-binding protein
MHALETRRLTYRFGSDKVLDDVNLQVEQGTIYGFLGPNGAGKTTTLKLALGLLRKQEGTIQVFGMPFEQSRLQVLRRIGSLIESPSLYGHLTATENLRIWQRIYDCPKERIAHVLGLVGLSDTGRKNASQFSLGMKQRLSIATALLHTPDMLILDEPTNGLDPNGIIEIRELLKKLSHEEGLTILISSHLLAEIEKLVSHVGIIHKGKMLFQGRFEELKQRQQQTTATILGVSNSQAAEALLHERGIAAVREDGMLVLPQLAVADVESIVRALVERQIGVHEVTTRKNDLESIFINLVSQ